MANELCALELLPTPGVFGAAALVKSEVRSSVLALQNPHVLLARTQSFIRWSGGKQALKDPDYLPIAHDLDRFSGLSWEEYSTGAYAALSRYAILQNWNDVTEKGVFFELDTWLKGIRETAAIRKWFAVNTIDVKQLRSRWKKDSSVSFASAGPLWRTPVISDGSYRFCASLALLYNSMGDGLYFLLFDSYGEETGDDTKKLRLSHFYGSFVEQYVTDIVSRAYYGRRDTTIYENVPYSGGEATDVILAEGNNILFIEVVGKRLQMMKSIVQLDEDAIIADIAAGVSKKVAELDKHIAQFQNGNLLPGLHRKSGQKIIPVIVSPAGWPRIKIIEDVLPALLKEHTSIAKCEPIELLDLSEIESPEASFTTGLSFGELLNRKNKSSRANRLMSLNNYLYYVEPHTCSNDPSPTRLRGDGIALRIMDLFRSWVG